ncbi:dicarboxylate/amino acid:cation symporter [Desulfovibrio sp. Huiquan2017]|uniref:dicarboxylate/amino acid:cation symporter n=1 Tax=Desulfovibrio sp. Huiquan2017 TaxID=2816861 RepID=UPI001A913699|nr:dicarboxylate/amino acid:cation symporter [Desulfovibrio sp. Huiquan2017]
MARWKNMGLPAKMGIGLILGVAAGFIWQVAGMDATIFKPVGTLFIRCIRMIVVPLVFASLVSGAAGMGDAAKLGRIATKTLAYYLLTTAVAVALGLFFANMVNPGIGLDLATTGAKIKEVAPPNMVDTLLNIVPLNPAAAFADGNLLQIIFFAIILGFAMSAIGEPVKPLLNIFDQINQVMIKLTGMIMELAPYGVFALIAYTVGAYGLAVLLPLIKLIVLMYVVCIIHICAVYLPLVTVYGRVNLKVFFKIISTPLLLAFTTCSSAAALPANMEATRKLGVPKNISSFTIPLGTTVNMDGAAIYLGIAAVFVAQVYSIPLSFNQQLTVLLMAVLASIGSVGVPSMALVVMTMVFTQVGLPMEGIALVAGVDRLLDMGRTTLNVLGDATGAIVVAKSEGELNPEAVVEETQTVA